MLAGAAWWVGALVFLLLFNALHLWMRAWGLRAGVRDGLAIGGTLRGLPFQPMGDRAAKAGAALAGFAAAVMAAQPGTQPWEWGAALAAAAVGIALGHRVRIVSALALALALLAGLLLART